MRPGRYWMRLRRFLTMAASWPTLRAARLPGPFFMFAQAPSAGLRVRSEGLLASHVLLQQQPRDPGWEKLCARSQLLLGDRSEALLTGLGYAIEPVPDGTVLREAGAGRDQRVAQFREHLQSWQSTA
jgi:hypothetical protein